MIGSVLSGIGIAAGPALTAATAVPKTLKGIKAFSPKALKLKILGDLAKTASSPEALLQKMAAINMLDEVQIAAVRERANALAERVVKAGLSPKKFQAGLEKRAQGPLAPPVSITGKQALILAGVGLGAAALQPLLSHGLTKGVDAISRALTKGGDFKKMMESNPGLAELDSTMVNRAFSTLHRFNPEYASDPLIAGSWIRRNVEWAPGEMPMDVVRDLVGARKTIREGRPRMDVDLGFTRDLAGEVVAPPDVARSAYLQQQGKRQADDPHYSGFDPKRITSPSSNQP